MLSEFIRKNILLSNGRGIDHTLIICFFALASIGFIMITSATLDYAYETTNPKHYEKSRNLGDLNGNNS